MAVVGCHSSMYTAGMQLWSGAQRRPPSHVYPEMLPSYSDTYTCQTPQGVWQVQLSESTAAPRPELAKLAGGPRIPWMEGGAVSRPSGPARWAWVRLERFSLPVEGVPCCIKAPPLV